MRTTTRNAEVREMRTDRAAAPYYNEGIVLDCNLDLAEVRGVFSPCKVRLAKKSGVQTRPMCE